MSYDINLHISETSDEGRAIASLAAKLRVTRDEAAKRLLKQAASQTARPARKRAPKDKRPGELLFGLFADSPEQIERVAREAREARDLETVREFGG